MIEQNIQYNLTLLSFKNNQFLNDHIWNITVSMNNNSINFSICEYLSQDNYRSHFSLVYLSKRDIHLTHCYNVLTVLFSKCYWIQYCIKQPQFKLRIRYRGDTCLQTLIAFVIQMYQPHEQKTLCFGNQRASGWHINDNRWRQRYLPCQTRTQPSLRCNSF